MVHVFQRVSIDVGLDYQKMEWRSMAQNLSILAGMPSSPDAFSGLYLPSSCRTSSGVRGRCASEASRQLLTGSRVVMDDKIMYRKCSECLHMCVN